MDFTREFNLLAGNKSDVELATMLRVSWPTIQRWRAGESAPHPVGREPILRALKDFMK